MKNGQISLCINISIIVTMMMFIGLLVASLEMLVHIYRGNHVQKLIDNNNNQTMRFKYNRSNLCPSHYSYWMGAMFFSYHDENCSFSSINIINRKNSTYKNDIIFINSHKKVNKTDQYITNGIRIIKPKSVQVTDFILALMLIGSAMSALVEMLRNRFMNYQDTSMRFGSFESKRPSIVDIILPGRCRSQELIKSSVKLDGLDSRRTPLRTLGPCTSTLMHRSSFQINFNFNGSITDSSQSLRSIRRTSVNVNNEASVSTSSGQPRRSRLIRRR